MYHLRSNSSFRPGEQPTNFKAGFGLHLGWLPPSLCRLSPLQVSPEDFAKLVECIAEADFDKCNDVPAGHRDGYLINPLGGIAVDMIGPTRYTLRGPKHVQFC